MQPKRHWRFSLKSLLLLAAVVSIALAWQAHRAERQAKATAAIVKMGGAVATEARQPQWLWSWCGERFSSTAVQASVPLEKAEAAIPLLTALPDLELVQVKAPPDLLPERRYDEIEQNLAGALPRAKVETLFPLVQIPLESVEIVDEAAAMLGFVTERDDAANE